MAPKTATLRTVMMARSAVRALVVGVLTIALFVVFVALSSSSWWPFTSAATRARLERAEQLRERCRAVGGGRLTATTTTTTAAAAAAAATTTTADRNVLSDVEVVAELRTFTGEITRVQKKDAVLPCTLRMFGSGMGEHTLCTFGDDPRAITRNDRATSPCCVFYSFGISQDYSFDRELAELGCFGYALDPSVTYPSRLLPGVQFMQVAATAIGNDGTGPSMWDTVSSVPSLYRWLRHERVHVLKMDCEGCEFAIAQDVLRENPTFFHNVDQFAVEVHVPKIFMKTAYHAHNYALLLRQLREAGLELVHAHITGCHPDDEKSGCQPALAEAGYPCGPVKMCQNFLFARPM